MQIPQARFPDKLSDRQHALTEGLTTSWGCTTGTALSPTVTGSGGAGSASRPPNREAFSGNTTYEGSSHTRISLKQHR